MHIFFLPGLATSVAEPCHVLAVLERNWNKIVNKYLDYQQSWARDNTVATT